MARIVFLFAFAGVLAFFITAYVVSQKGETEKNLNCQMIGIYLTILEELDRAKKLQDNQCDEALQKSKSASDASVSVSKTAEPSSSLTTRIRKSKQKTTRRPVKEPSLVTPKGKEEVSTFTESLSSTTIEFQEDYPPDYTDVETSTSNVIKTTLAVHEIFTTKVSVHTKIPTTSDDNLSLEQVIG